MDLTFKWNYNLISLSFFLSLIFSVGVYRCSGHWYSLWMKELALIYALTLPHENDMNSTPNELLIFSNLIKSFEVFQRGECGPCAERDKCRCFCHYWYVDSVEHWTLNQSQSLFTYLLRWRRRQFQIFSQQKSGESHSKHDWLLRTLLR